MEVFVPIGTHGWQKVRPTINRALLLKTQPKFELNKFTSTKLCNFYKTLFLDLFSEVSLHVYKLYYKYYSKVVIAYRHDSDEGPSVKCQSCNGSGEGCEREHQSQNARHAEQAVFPVGVE